MLSRKPSLFFFVSWLIIIFLTVPPLIKDADSQAPESKPLVLSQPVRPGRVTVLDLHPRFTTAIRVPAVVSSIAVGDPMLFKIEHSEREPEMVFVKPTSVQPAESNLLITTANGQTLSLLLRSRGEKRATDPGLEAESAHAVHFLLNYQPGNSFLISEVSAPSVLIPQTVSLSSNPEAPKQAPFLNFTGHSTSLIDTLLDQQKQSKFPNFTGKTLCGGIGQIYEKKGQVYVPFTLVNRSHEALEVLTPQVQLAQGSRKSGFSAHSEQLAISDYRLARRRLGPNERADGVVVFQKPAFKLFDETYWLQIAGAGAVDHPVLIPIPLSKSILLDGGQRQ
jgi:hypothetical protein